jgi:hypothetical protein
VTIAELWRRDQVGWPRRFPIAQFPNPPLLLAFAGWGLPAVAGETACRASLRRLQPNPRVGRRGLRLALAPCHRIRENRNHVVRAQSTMGA